MDKEDLECGELLCLRCGDCYHCYKDTLCYDGGTHYFDLSSVDIEDDYGTYFTG